MHACDHGYIKVLIYLLRYRCQKSKHHPEPCITWSSRLLLCDRATINVSDQDHYEWR